MMTKEEEKNLLAKIEKLLNTADPDGYVASAFRGCVDLAHRNIENDFCESFEENLRLTQEDATLTYAKLAELQNKYAEERCDHERVAQEHNEAMNAMHEEYSDVTDRLQQALYDLSAEKARTERYRRMARHKCDEIVLWRRKFDTIVKELDEERQASDRTIERLRAIVDKQAAALCTLSVRIVDIHAQTNN
jgi:chromosome segregation ATPase